MIKPILRYCSLCDRGAIYIYSWKHALCSLCEAEMYAEVGKDWIKKQIIHQHRQ